MNRLIIESSTAQVSLAIFQGEQLQCEEIFPGGRGPASTLFSNLQRMVTGINALDEIIVGVGPGSYSGIRIGISAAIGLKLAREIPAFGIVSALGYPGADFQVIHDARGQWTYLDVKNNQLIGEPLNLTKEELDEKIDRERPVFSERAVPFLSIISAFPLASVLGKRAWDDATCARLPLDPLYLKPPHITAAKTSPLIPQG